MSIWSRLTGPSAEELRAKHDYGSRIADNKALWHAEAVGIFENKMAEAYRLWNEGCFDREKVVKGFSEGRFRFLFDIPSIEEAKRREIQTITIWIQGTEDRGKSYLGSTRVLQACIRIVIAERGLS